MNDSGRGDTKRKISSTTKGRKPAPRYSQYKNEKSGYKKPSSYKNRSNQTVNVKKVVTPVDGKISQSKSNTIKEAITEPHYVLINSHIVNSIESRIKTNGGDVSPIAYKVRSNRSRWKAISALTFEINVFKKDTPSEKRAVMVYYVSKDRDKAQVMVVDTPKDSSAILFSYCGDESKLNLAKYLTQIIASTELLLLAKTKNPNQKGK